jgi:hypothetical protein
LANYSAAAKYISAEYTATPVTPEQKQADDATFQSYINNGKAAFDEVVSRLPESYLGYLWLANLYSLVDFKTQETKGSAIQGVAKPYFEKAVEVMLANNEDGKRNKDIIGAYNYLASYYMLKSENSKEDTKSAGEYYKKIIEIDPANADAKKALDAMHIKY